MNPLDDNSRWTVSGRFDCDRCGVNVAYHAAACIAAQISDAGDDDDDDDQ